MSELLDKQLYFAESLAKFILQLRAQGYGVTLGETYRPPETAELYAKQGKGSKNSLHTMRLAVDICLFEDGVYLKETWQYRRASELWKAYSTDKHRCVWGGSFSKPDGNHFSIAWNGLE